MLPSTCCALFVSQLHASPQAEDPILSLMKLRYPTVPIVCWGEAAREQHFRAAMHATPVTHAAELRCVPCMHHRGLNESGPHQHQGLPHRPGKQESVFSVTRQHEHHKFCIHNHSLRFTAPTAFLLQTRTGPKPWVQHRWWLCYAC